MNESLLTPVPSEPTYCHCNREVHEDNKCIFHCEKTSWYRIEKEKKIWNPTKVQDFWNEFENEVINESKEKLDFSDCTFPILSVNKDYLFTSSLFDEKIQYYEILRPIIFTDSKFLDDIYFNGFKFNGVDFSNTKFEKGVSFERCLFTEELDYAYIDNQVTMAPENRISFNANNMSVQENALFNDAEFHCKAVFYSLNRDLKKNNSSFLFNNTKFLKLADFWNASFNKVSFEKTDFEGITVFTKTTFNKYFEFKYTRFDKQLVLNRTLFKDGFDLYEALYNSDNVIYSNVVFKGKANHRETYRVIKFILDRRANFIDADKYYALEMGSYRKELLWESPLSWFLLCLGKVISNYGNNWWLPLVLAIVLSIVIFFSVYLNTYTSISLFSLDWLKSGAIDIYPSFSSSLASREFVDFLNPFSKVLADDKSVFYNNHWAWFTQKIVFGIGMYHFIVAVKRKTRR